ncbi:MAG: alpha/beta hydrolase [Bacteroidales bacterium]|nr:alpha/beta hydrolase [Bacteroidales bacterium]
MPQKSIHTPIIALLLFLLLVANACHKSDNAQLAAGDCFVTSVNNNELIVRLDDLQPDKISGSYFYTNALFADPHPFTVELKGAKGRLNADALPGSATIKWTTQQNKLKVRCKTGNLPQEMVLVKCTSRDNTVFHRQFCDSLYSVKMTPDVEYARANGFWTSYPDEDKPFAEIYTERIPQLIKMEEQPLCMDIYEPVDDPANMRPLVLMIHGGAFYNGDKQDETYVKWCRHYASLGYVAVSLNYRMGFLPYKNAIDCAGYRATQDANAALRYLMHHAATYRINPDWVFTWGTSAGAITALNVAFMKDANRPESVTKEGKINKLAPTCTETFHVKAVANMWGAVHDTAILANHNISVISFHGDADGIVPYDYGIPFKDMLNSSVTEEVNRQLNRAVSLVDDPSSNKFLDKARSILTPITEKIGDWTEPFTRPVWNMIISPMYGSACIHKYLNRHNIRNKLFTEEGADQHSLHVDEHRNIVPYFYTIQDSVARFFYTEIIEKPVNIRQENPMAQYFIIDGSNVAEVHWQVDGGALLELSGNKTKIVFFKDAARHTVRVCGKYKNGVEFCEEIVV